uniref:cell division protein n=1 Tax=Watanabea sichuanensis TaxID=2704660 RepID=UPI0024113BF5|nr:cell division protein [Watanabea sichuanensis]WDY13147.1 cell division protein [Watanabea sichuanensis]
MTISKNTLLNKHISFFYPAQNELTPKRISIQASHPIFINKECTLIKNGTLSYQKIKGYGMAGRRAALDKEPFSNNTGDYVHKEIGFQEVGGVFKNSELDAKDIDPSPGSGDSASKMTTEKLLDLVFSYQELVVEWVNRIFPRPSAFTLACGATLYLVALCTTIQRQEGNRWFAVFIDGKLPGLSEPSQKSLWDSFENVTSQYVTLGQNEKTESLCDSSIISKVDLYKKRVLIRLQSPWDKQSRQQYAGIFSDHTTLPSFDKLNTLQTPACIRSLPPSGVSERDGCVLGGGVQQSPQALFSQNRSLGIQSWYQIPARNDYNPILFSKDATKKEKKFYYHQIKNPLTKTKNWFPLTNKISLWDYFPFHTSKEQVYLGGDNIPSKLDSALFLSSFRSARSFGLPQKDGFFGEGTDDNNKIQSKTKITEDLPVSDFGVSKLALGEVKNLSPKSTDNEKQLQKLPLIQEGKIGFTYCHCVELNPAYKESIQGSHLVQDNISLMSANTQKNFLESNLVACELSSTPRKNTTIQGGDALRRVLDSNGQAFQKSTLTSQVLDTRKLRLWFDQNKELTNGDEFHVFENKLKSLFYSQGVLPPPELDDLDDEVFEENEEKDDLDNEVFEENEEKDDLDIEVFEENEEKKDKTFGEILGNDKGHSDSDAESWKEDENDKVVTEVISLESQKSSESFDRADFSNNSLPSFSSHFYKTTWTIPRLMSGYQFPELTKKDIFDLHRRFIIRHLLPSLNLTHPIHYGEGRAGGTSSSSSSSSSYSSFPRVCEAQVCKQGLPFNVFNNQRFARKISLIPMEINLPPALPAYLFRDMFSPSFFSPFHFQEGLASEFYKSAEERLNRDHNKVPELKLRYRVIELEEEKEVEKMFAKLRRDYKDYLSHPKEGLEALKVSPSIEDEEKNKDSLAEAREKDRKAELGKILQKFAYKKGYAVRKEKKTSDLPDTKHTNLNPWISSLWGTENMLSDRKSSFFGIQNVLRKRVINRELKNIATEILSPTNPPLTKIKARGRRTDICLTKPTKFEAKNDVGSQHRILKVNSRLRKKQVISTNLATPFETHHIMPEITKDEWRKMIEYQLRQYFFKEERRLDPLLKKNPHHHFKIQRVNTFLPWVTIRTPKEKSVEWPLTRLDYEKINLPKHDFVVHKDSHTKMNGYLKNNKFQAPPQEFTHNLVSKNKVILSSRKPESEQDSGRFPHSSGLLAAENSYLSSPGMPSKPLTTSQYNWVPPKLREWAYFVLEQINKFQLTPYFGRKVLSQHLTFEPLTKYSWLLIYRFFLVFALRGVAKYLYKATLKDFLIRMAHTHFGLAVTSEEFRKWLQHVPPKLFYKPHKRLQDVAGLDEKIPALSEIIWFLRNSGRGGGVPRAVLLVGPPGTGKTFLVQAIAGEAQVPVVVQSMSALSRTDLGERPYERLHEMFQIARKQAPCILFMDEIDAIAESREGVVTNDIGAPDSLFSLEEDPYGRLSYSLQSELLSKSDTRFNTTHLKDVSIHQKKKETEVTRVNLLLRLLTEIDGLRPLNGVVLIATTNRPAVLDPALLRPGRFEKIIHLQLPSHKKRIDLFKLHTKKIGSVEKMPWDYLATRTADMSGADIASAINQSAIRAILHDTVHTVETLEHGLNYVTGAPVSFAPVSSKSNLPDLVNSASRTPSPGQPWRRVSVKGSQVEGPAQASVKFDEERLSGDVAYGLYAVSGVFVQDGIPWKGVSRTATLKKNHFSEKMKQAFNTSRLAYYQAGKGVVQSVLRSHPKVGFLAFSPDNNNQFPFTKTSWQKLTSPQAHHRKIDLETIIIGLYAGKAAEMLQLSGNSFKNDSSCLHLLSPPQTVVPHEGALLTPPFPVEDGTAAYSSEAQVRSAPERGTGWQDGGKGLHRLVSAPAVLEAVLQKIDHASFKLAHHKRAWLWQSNLGLPELLIASSLIHLMVDRWYLYSKKLFSLKTNRLIASLNEEEISNDDLFPIFAKLCEELDRDGLNRRTSSSYLQESDASKQKLHELVEKQGGIYLLLEEIEQERLILAWWQEKIYKGIEMSERPYSKWYRIYLPKVEERERNEEWVDADFYYNHALSLPTLSQKKLSDSDATLLQSKASHNLFKEVKNRLSAPSPSPSPTGQGQGQGQGKGGFASSMTRLSQKALFLNSKEGRKKKGCISLQAQSGKTWNDLYWLERDYSYHNLVTTSFYTAFLLLDENRELLDFLADHLIRFQKLRKHEILRICSLFQMKMSGAHPFTVDDESDQQTHQRYKEHANAVEKTLTLSESSTPLSPSWWEDKVLNEALLSTKMGLTKISSGKESTTTPLNKEPTDFGQGGEIKDKKSKDYSYLSRMTDKKPQKPEPKLKKHPITAQFTNTVKEPFGNEFNKTPEESTSITRISPASSLNQQSNDAQDQQSNDAQEKQQNKRFWILEKGWGRYSRYKKPNFFRFDFIKVR